MTRRLLAYSLLLSSVGGAGCFFPADRGRLLEGKVDSMSEETERLKIALRETQERLDKTTARLQDALAQLDTSSRTSGANIGVRVDSAIQDAAMLRGQLEATQHRLQELEQRLADRLAGPSGPTETKDKELKRPDDPKEFLKLADEKVKDDVELGRKLYNELLKKWPRDEVAGEAHFGLGESYLGEKKCREALYEYGKVIQDYAKSSSAPMAYVHSADCFKELKMLAESKLALEEVQRQHPKSEAAKLAKQRLAELSKSAPKAKK
jgi:TolA-binding protein